MTFHQQKSTQGNENIEFPFGENHLCLICVVFTQTDAPLLVIYSPEYSPKTESAQQLVKPDLNGY